MKSVSLILFRMFHYRIDFLNALRSKLEVEGYELNVYYGKPTKQSLERQDSEVLSWAQEINTKTLTIGGKEILLQLAPFSVFKSDVVICMHENRLLINYALQLLTWLTPKCHFTFFGHGKNFQSTAQHGIKEKIKKILLARSDHFFAYTNLSKQVLLSNGYDSNKITVVNNTIDVNIFSKKVNGITADAILEYTTSLDIPQYATVALFCGSIYELKKPEFLVDAAIKIRKKIPNLYLVVIGAGPSENIIRHAAKENAWIRYRGMQKGHEKALAYASCKVILNPGLVGLHIVDALSAGKPMVTTNMPYHSPEYAYLEHNVNGIVTDENVDSYANAVVELLTNQNKLRQLSNAAMDAKDNYNLSNMVDAFVQGIKTVTK